jgi:hypothetical protein
MAGTYSGVDQTTPETSCIANATAATTVAFGAAVNYENGAVVVYVAGNGGTTANIADDATLTFSTTTSQIGSLSHTMHARDTATTGSAGTLANPTTVTFSGSTSARSSAAIIALIPAPTDATAPSAGTVTVSPDVSGYTSGTPSISTVFTDAESAVSTCQYTTNGGTNWFAGTVTPGPGANEYTCSATPSITGSVTINMRATSSGGTTTASAISRTVDTTAPANGTLNGTPGNNKVTLDWSGQTDAGAGLAATGTYTIRRATGATAPANCTAGTLIGTFDDGTTTTNDLTVTNGTAYSYRICTTDAVGNQNTGATATNIIPAAGAREALTSSNTAVAVSPQPDTFSAVVMQRVQVNSTAVSGGDDGKLEIASVDIDYTGTVTSVDSAKVYIDTAASFNIATAVELGVVSAWNGSSANIVFGGTQAQREVSTGTPKYLYIVFDMATGQAPNNLTSHVTAIYVNAPDDGQPSVSYASNAITLQVGPKTSVSTCGDCHGNPPVDSATRSATTGRFPGSHNKHAGTYSMACTTCHVNNATLNHRNGTIQMSGQVGTAYKGGSFAQTPTPSAYQSCAIYCHSMGTGATGQAGDTRTLSSPNATMTWATSTSTCTTCHSTPPAYANKATTWGAAKANSHSSHPTDCSICHNDTTTDGVTVTDATKHTNQTYDVVPKAGFSFSYTYNVAGGLCSTVSCHGGGSPRWGTGAWDCVTCHSGSMTKTLGGGGTLRQVVGTGGDFNMGAVPTGSRHLFGATTIVKWDCIVCHMEGWYTTANAGKANAAYHNEGSGATGGKVNLRNVDSPETGFAVDNKAWTTTDYTNMDNFCVTCHDANGSSAIAVNATNDGLLTGSLASSTMRAGWKSMGGTFPGSAAMSPFNSTDWRSGYNGASTSNAYAGEGRAKMVNVKDQFYAGSAGAGASYNGNPSQHAVLGQRYATRNTGWLTAAWSDYVSKKTGINLKVSGETALLSCADCHVLDAGNGAHGGERKYNLWGSSIWGSGQNSMCDRCHSFLTYRGGGAANGSRFNHTYSRSNSSSYGLPQGSVTVPSACFTCHASYDSMTTIGRMNTYGGIHGSWTSTGGVGSTVAGYRFFPGTWRRQAMTTANYNSTTAGSCYFPANNTSGFSNCTSHSGTGTATVTTPAYPRPVNY